MVGWVVGRVGGVVKDWGWVFLWFDGGKLSVEVW